jgi:hypothetical protein
MSFDIKLSEEGLLTITPPEEVMDKDTFLTEFVDSLFWKVRDI